MESTKVGDEMTRYNFLFQNRYVIFLRLNLTESMLSEIHLKGFVGTITSTFFFASQVHKYNVAFSERYFWKMIYHEQMQRRIQNPVKHQDGVFCETVDAFNR